MKKKMQDDFLICMAAALSSLLAWVAGDSPVHIPPSQAKKLLLPLGKLWCTTQSSSLLPELSAFQWESCCGTGFREWEKGGEQPGGAIPAREIWIIC